MKKSERQETILNIVRGGRIRTQEELAALLRARGSCATQATVSRDIRELQLTKLPDQDGQYQYADPGGHGRRPSVPQKLQDVLGDGYLSAEPAGNLVVVKTVTGMAPACALAMDALRWPEIVGTLAGDDTIMVVVRSASAAHKLTKKFESLYHNGVN